MAPPPDVPERILAAAGAGNWCVGAALDDDQLDIPGYRPRTGYRPAAGTGIAADIRLPVRRYRRKGA
jgi:hypothetical protein